MDRVNPTRRTVVGGLMAGAAMSVLPRTASAQDAYPSRAIRVIVPFAAGSATDIMMRHLAPRMSQDLGQQLVIDNRVGAAGVLGSEAVVRAAPDGYTLNMAAVSSHAIAPAIRKTMPYDVLRDFTPIGLSCTSTNFIVVHPSVPAKTLQELIAYSKTLPKGLDYGSGGIGGSNHLAGELLKLRTGANLVHVPYSNQANAVNDVVAGQIPMLIYTVAVMTHVSAGRLRALAATSEVRQVQAPDVPTAVEQGAKDVVANSWFGFFGPAKLPVPIRDKLSAALTGALRDPDIAKKLLDAGLTPAPMAPDAFGNFVTAEIDKWREVGKASGVVVE